MTPVAERAPTARLTRLISCIRFDEVLRLQGTPLLGALFAMGPLTPAKYLNLLVLALASSLLVAHVFVLNDWSGSGTDLRDPQRAARLFTAKGIHPPEFVTLALLLLVPSLLLLTPFGRTPLSLAVALAILSALYSAPPFAMKGLPVASSALHLAGGLLHFLLGYSLFHPLDVRSLGLGGFFALTFTAGHLTHEVRDFEFDRINGIETNAVKFGPANSFAAAFLLFTAAHFLLFALARTGAVPSLMRYAIALYPLHLWWTWQARAAGLSFANVQRLQQRYRALYALIGLWMCAAVNVKPH